MSSSSKGKTDADLRLDGGDDSLIFPEHAEPTDEAPTIISKHQPHVMPVAAANDNITDLSARAAFSEGLVNGFRGRRLAHYELIEPIGVGGMAAVLRAHDTQLDRQVALKILPPEMAADPENVRRFHQEAKAAARLDHQNIGRVFFCGEDQGLHFIAFEFVEGENLRTLLDRRGRIPVPEAVRYVLQIAAGLEHASSRGVVHRDVKPSNIIVSANGQAKLVDMGLARNMERQEQDLTQSGVTLGTFDYISPEQAMEPRDADARSDIYSLGCTFYHMLTGQAPVPEGTAAKKLHHHQHIAPTDPRQLNREIPDEVALILGRMMHKDPRARYQRPLQLVQHLMQVARKVGAADDLPEGVLMVDTPLPTGPRSRPLLIVSVMAAALAIAVGLLVTGPGDNQVVVPPGMVVAPDAAKDKKDAGGPGDLTPSIGVPSVAGAESIRNANDLVAAAKNLGLTDRGSLKINSTIDLSGLTQPVRLSAGKDKEIVVERAPSTTSKVTIQFQPGSAGLSEGLVLGEGRFTFKNLRFRIEAAGDPEQTSIAAIAIRGATHVRFEKCIFEQRGMPPFDPNKRERGVVSVLVEHDPASAQQAPKVEFDECYFHGSQDESPGSMTPGQVAVAVNGPANISATNCGFKPHGAFFQVLNRSQLGTTSIKMDRCSGFVFGGPVFRFDLKASAELTARNCMFSSYENSLVSRGESDFIRQFDETRIQYQGNGNCYHNLNSLWTAGTSIKNNMSDFVEALSKSSKPAGSSYDEASRVLTSDDEKSPWYAAFDPVFEKENIAFQVKPDYGVYGLKTCFWGDLAQAAAPVLNLASKVKLLDPDYKGNERNVFNTLEKALPFLEKDDTLLVKPGKLGREIKISPAKLKVDITIKAYEKTTPVLALDNPEEKVKDFAFFRVKEGKLRLEGLHFVLDVRQDGVGQSVLLLGDTAEATIDHCVVTIRAKNGASVVSFVDPKDWMRPEPRPTSTKVTFTNSFIRGDGDLIRMTACRPIELTVDNTVVALSGSLTSVQATVGDDLPADQGPQVKLNKATVLTRDPVFSLKAFKNGKGLAQLHVNATSSLFAPISDKPLVFLESSDVGSEDLVTKYLDWRGAPNSFAKFDKFLVQQGPNDAAPAMMLEADRWRKLFGGAKADSEVPNMPPMIEMNLSQESPASLRPVDPNSQFAEFGAAPELDSLIKALK